MAGGPAVGGGKKGSAAQTVGVLNLLTDLAFNLLIFFVVCASTEPEKGRLQDVPNASKENAAKPKSQNLEVKITRTTVAVNGTVVPDDEFFAKMKDEFKDKTKQEDRIVVIRSDKDTPYSQWIKATGAIEKAGGVITLRLEE
ncbi:MAG: biopolymer transporter ExbD [Planctomycetes bacterium]|nr:biopolymer transporter ExbD [Planctomycetota bacterium]